MPCVYRKDGDGLKFYTEYTDRIFEIDGSGFGVVLMKTKLLKDSFDKFKTCFQPIPGFGEDLSFCIRAKQLGYQLFADPNIEIGHIGKTVISKNAWRNHVIKSEVGIKDHN